MVNNHGHMVGREAEQAREKEKATSEPKAPSPASNEGASNRKQSLSLGNFITKATMWP